MKFAQTILTCLLIFSMPLMASANRTFLGPKVKIGNGYGRSFVTTDQKHEPAGIGIILSADALRGLPMQGESSYTLRLPSGVSVKPYKHLTVDWNAHGHDPIPIYGKPHFDFHFYTISESLRNQITCQGEDSAICMKQPPAALIPEDYIPTPAGVPKMGWHWVDGQAPEFHGQDFTATFIYGYYNGTFAFVEPMVTLDFLKSVTHYSAEVKQPSQFNGFLPSNWEIEFDDKSETYRIILNL